MKENLQQISGSYLIDTNLFIEKLNLPSGMANKKYWGTFTYKNGKLSISIPDRRYNSWYANDLINKIVKEEFEHYQTSPIFRDITEVKGDLVSELREKTQDLKNDFFEKTKAAAKRQFDYAESHLPIIKQETADAWQEYRSLKSNAPGYWDASTKWKELNKRKEKLQDVVSKGYEKFLASEMEYAELHYESSLVKLAARLTDKGVTGDMEITSGYVGPNFEVTIKHDKGITRAWTIVAEGPIVRAHYRYLIK